MTVRNVNLVTPLPQNGTATHRTDTVGSSLDRSGAVSRLKARSSDVKSVNERRFARTSTTATRTTTTSTTSCRSGPSADSLYLFEDLIQAYLDCRKHKRNTGSALAFEENLERNLWSLHQDLQSGTYQPGRSICFAITRPKPREVWAAEFRDRIVHHLLHNHIGPRFYARFIADSCACIKGRGTLYAADRLESKVRSITQNWSKPAFYLKCDLANFFVSIDKTILRELLAKYVTDPWWMQLTDTVLFHDPRQNYELHGEKKLLELVPPHKRLALQPEHLGLPIGNLSSQFFANIYLDVLDQFVKHGLRCKHYIRYVDDFVLLHESREWLAEAHRQIEAFLPAALGVRLNPKKTILQPIARGIDFVGQVIKPWHRTIRRKTFNTAMQRIAQVEPEGLLETANSYFGLMRQATHSHGDRAKLANDLRRRGHTIKSDLTKTYRRAA